MASTEPEKLKAAVDDCLKLVEMLKVAKKPVPPQVEAILNAMKEGTEVGISAEEASQHMANFLKVMDDECQVAEANGGDDAYVCLAKREGTEGSIGYLGRLNWVLNPNNPMSVVSIYWKKKTRYGWACVWDEVRNGSPSGLYRKCFIEEGKPGHLSKAAQ